MTRALENSLYGLSYLTFYHQALTMAINNTCLVANPSETNISQIYKTINYLRTYTPSPGKTISQLRDY